MRTWKNTLNTENTYNKCIYRIKLKKCMKNTCIITCIILVTSRLTDKVIKLIEKEI